MEKKSKPYLHSQLTDYTRGWLVGDFQPAILKKKDVEVALKTYQAGQKELPHYHKLTDEFTLILKGCVNINKVIYKEGSIICIPANGISYFEALENTTTLVIRTGSFPNDKYILEDKL